MQRLKENHRNFYDLNNCFGFTDRDADLSLWDNSSMMDQTSIANEFLPNKPYRLALYVRPTEQKRLQRTKAINLVKNAAENKQENKKSETLNVSGLTEKKDSKRNTRTNKKLSVALFDENIKVENMLKKTENSLEKMNMGKTITEAPSTRKNILKEVNVKSLTRTKQSKVRRSYERKFKEKEESENVPEPSSEEIIKDMEFKKILRTKQKKIAKEEQEFEKWANNMNSAFEDVDKFELSIAYD